LFEGSARTASLSEKKGRKSGTGRKIIRLSNKRTKKKSVEKLPEIWYVENY